MEKKTIKGWMVVYKKYQEPAFWEIFKTKREATIKMKSHVAYKSLKHLELILLTYKYK